MKRIIFFLLLLASISCSKNIKIKKVSNNSFENDVYIDSQGCQYIKITEDYKQVKDNLTGVSQNLLNIVFK